MLYIAGMGQSQVQALEALQSKMDTFQYSSEQGYKKVQQTMKTITDVGQQMSEGREQFSCFIILIKQRF